MWSQHSKRAARLSQCLNLNSSNTVMNRSAALDWKRRPEKHIYEGVIVVFAVKSIGLETASCVIVSSPLLS